MEKNRKITIILVITLIISVIGLGIAFAAFSTTLNINGNATVESSSWKVVFEGTTSTTTLAAPTLTGTATEVTHPTIKNNSTEISNYSVTLMTPGDSVTYNFKIHNKGDYAADVSTLTIAGVTNPSYEVRGANLVTDSSIASENLNTLEAIRYKLYYTDTNTLVGQDEGKDCLEPGEIENVSLRIVFASTATTTTSILPSSNLTLDNLGVSILYNQCGNGSCTYEQGEPITDVPFQNIDGAYYTYEGKSFIGTGVNNVIISEKITTRKKYASAAATECSDESTPVNYKCPSGATPVFNDHPAADAAAAYCTGCRLMTKSELASWIPCREENMSSPMYCHSSKIIAKLSSTATAWWIDAAYSANKVFYVTNNGDVSRDTGPTSSTIGVRPVVSISSSATITGSGTSTSPYVITQ